MKWLFLFSFSFFLSCPGLIQAPPAPVGSGIPINDVPTPSNPDQKTETETKTTDAVTLPSLYEEWGLVTCLKSEEIEKDYQAFTSSLKEFLSTSTNPATQTWWVKCNHKDKAFTDWKGGFFIRGKVTFENRKIFQTENTTQNLTPTQSSHIELHITEHSNERLVIKPLILSLKQYSNSSINGNNVYLTFKDKNGEITLSGTIKLKNINNAKKKEPVISGTMSFNNLVRFNGTTPGSSGQIGPFHIRACSFLDCKQKTNSLPEGI